MRFDRFIVAFVATAALTEVWIVSEGASNPGQYSGWSYHGQANQQGYYPQQQQQQPQQLQQHQGYPGESWQGQVQQQTEANQQQAQSQHQQQQELQPEQNQQQQQQQPPLPYGWTEHFDPASGQPYYHNVLDGTVTWDRPEPDVSADTSGNASSGYPTEDSAGDSMAVGTSPELAGETNTSSESKDMDSSMGDQRELSGDSSTTNLQQGQTIAQQEVGPDADSGKSFMGGNTDQFSAGNQQIVEPSNAMNSIASVEDGNTLTDYQRSQQAVEEENRWRARNGWSGDGSNEAQQQQMPYRPQQVTAENKSTPQNWGMPPRPAASWFRPGAESLPEETKAEDTAPGNGEHHAAVSKGAEPHTAQAKHVDPRSHTMPQPETGDHTNPRDPRAVVPETGSTTAQSSDQPTDPSGKPFQGRWGLPQPGQGNANGSAGPGFPQHRDAPPSDSRQGPPKGPTDGRDGQFSPSREAPINRGPPGVESPINRGPPGVESPINRGPPGVESPINRGPPGGESPINRGPPGRPYETRGPFGGPNEPKINRGAQRPGPSQRSWNQPPQNSPPGQQLLRPGENRNSPSQEDPVNKGGPGPGQQSPGSGMPLQGGQIQQGRYPDPNSQRIGQGAPRQQQPYGGYPGQLPQPGHYPPRYGPPPGNRQLNPTQMPGRPNGGQLIPEETKNSVQEAFGSAWKGILGFRDRTNQAVGEAANSVAYSAREAGQAISSTSTNLWGQAVSGIGSIFESNPDEQVDYSLSGKPSPPTAPGAPGSPPGHSMPHQYPPQGVDPRYQHMMQSQQTPGYPGQHMNQAPNPMGNQGPNSMGRHLSQQPRPYTDQNQAPPRYMQPPPQSQASPDQWGRNHPGYPQRQPGPNQGYPQQPQGYPGAQQPGSPMQSQEQMRARNQSDQQQPKEKKNENNPWEHPALGFDAF